MQTTWMSTSYSVSGQMIFVNKIFQKVYRFECINNIKVGNNLTSYHILRDNCADSSEFII